MSRRSLLYIIDLNQSRPDLMPAGHRLLESATIRCMPDAPSLRLATADEIADALSFAMRYQGRKRVHHADDMMARITAERLVQHLEASGFVLMKGPPRLAPTTGGMPPSLSTVAGAVVTHDFSRRSRPALNQQEFRKP